MHYFPDNDNNLWNNITGVKGYFSVVVSAARITLLKTNNVMILPFTRCRISLHLCRDKDIQYFSLSFMLMLWYIPRFSQISYPIQNFSQVWKLPKRLIRLHVEVKNSWELWKRILFVYKIATSSIHSSSLKNSTRADWYSWFSGFKFCEIAQMSIGLSSGRNTE